MISLVIAVVSRGIAVSVHTMTAASRSINRAMACTLNCRRRFRASTHMLSASFPSPRLNDRQGLLPNLACRRNCKCNIEP
jgi:hypothetical protein